MGHYGMTGYGIGGGVFTVLFHLLFWALLIAGVYFLIRWVTTNATQAGNAKGETSNQPLEIIKHRYAKGQITREEYEQLKQDLA